jgi:hypothetical protein
VTSTHPVKYLVRDSGGREHTVEATKVEVTEIKDGSIVTFTKGGDPVAQFKNPPNWGPAPA